MLQRLRIENFAIIHKLELCLAQGLVIFTGETGAGKSIILDALEAVMGGKSDATNVRSGAERATWKLCWRSPRATAPRSSICSSAKTCWTTTHAHPQPRNAPRGTQRCPHQRAGGH